MKKCHSKEVSNEQGLAACAEAVRLVPERDAGRHPVPRGPALLALGAQPRRPGGARRSRARHPAASPVALRPDRGAFAPTWLPLAQLSTHAWWRGGGCGSHTRWLGLLGILLLRQSVYGPAKGCSGPTVDRKRVMRMLVVVLCTSTAVLRMALQRSYVCDQRTGLRSRRIQQSHVSPLRKGPGMDASPVL